MSHQVYSEIILVEDNPHDAELFSRTLQKVSPDSKIVVCEDGEDLLNYLFSQNDYAGNPEPSGIRVIFLDLKMPKISGHEVLHLIRREDRFKRTPVVVVTSSAEDRDIIDAYSAGANSYVVKPVGFDEYTQAISQACLYWIKMNVIA